MRDILRLKEESEAMKDNIIGDIGTLFDSKRRLRQSIRINRTNNHIKQKINGDENKTIPIKENLEEIKPYLKDVINNLKNLMQGKSS